MTEPPVLCQRLEEFVMIHATHGPQIVDDFIKFHSGLVDIAAVAPPGGASENYALTKLTDPDLFTNWLKANHPHLVKKDPPPMNIIIQALIDSKDTLQSLRQRCSAQELEKIDALCTHLHYLATTTEVVMQGDFLCGPTHDPVSPEAEIAAVTAADKKLADDLRSITEDDLVRMNPDPDRVTKNLGDIRAKPGVASHPSEAYIGRDGKHAIVWVPEAPGHPGIYAYEPKNATDKRNCTSNIHDALQFMFQQQCIEWCARHPVPVFVPREHEFLDLL